MNSTVRQILLCWNIDGLASKLTDHDLLSYVCGFDEIDLVETVLDKSFELTTHCSDFETVQASAVK